MGREGVGHLRRRGRLEIIIAMKIISNATPPTTQSAIIAVLEISREGARGVEVVGGRGLFSGVGIGAGEIDGGNETNVETGILLVYVAPCSPLVPDPVIGVGVKYIVSPLGGVPASGTGSGTWLISCGS